MKKWNRIMLVGGLALASAFANAQEVSPVDFMRMNPYQMNSNPAAELPYKSVMSLLVGNVNVSLQNPSLHYDNFFDFGAQGKPTAWNLRKIASNIKDDNFLGFHLNENFFTLCRRLDQSKGMLSFGWDLKVQGDMRFDKGLFNLIGYGNSAFVGDDNPIRINMNLNMKAYQQFSVGYQFNLTRDLSIGGRAKLLFGMANVNTKSLEASLFTHPESYSLRLEESVAMMASLPSVFTIADGKLKTQGSFSIGDLFSNPGLGIDLAAEYHITEEIGVVAAVHDLGFISWGANNVSLESDIVDAGTYFDNDAFLFNGLDLKALQMVTTDDDYLSHFVDTLKQYFQVDLSKTGRYATMLNTNLLLRGYYDLDEQNRVSAQVQGTFLNSGFRPAVTLAYSGSFNEMFDVCATYTLMKDSYANFGLGLAGNFDTFHIYAATSNLFGAFKPLNSNFFNVQFGIVFNLREYRFNVGTKTPKFIQ